MYYKYKAIGVNSVRNQNTSHCLNVLNYRLEYVKVIIKHIHGFGFEEQSNANSVPHTIDYVVQIVSNLTC